MLKKSLLLLVVSLLFFFQTAHTQSETSVSKAILINASTLLNDVKILSADDMQGRQVGTAGGLKAREYLAGRFQQLGLRNFNNTYIQAFDFPGGENKKIEGGNVVGFVKGKENPDQYLVITAHYDHLGVREGQIFNGADDNASGVAALLAMAEYFSKHPPRNTLIFAALDAEESGFQGARTFVEKLTMPKAHILLNVNMDMISHNDANEIYVAGTRHYPFLKEYLEPVIKQSPIKVLFGHDQPDPPQDDWTNQSDHAVFHEAKIPFLYFGVEDHQDYHRPTDDYENINQTFYVHAVETILGAVKSFDANLVKREP